MIAQALYFFRDIDCAILFTEKLLYEVYMHLTEVIDRNIITVIDLETTGLDCTQDYIIEVGAVKIGGWHKVNGKDGQALIDKGNIIGQYSSLVSCPVKLSEKIVQLTGISDSILNNAPAIDVALKNLKEFVGDSIIVGHNIEFDFGFLHTHSGRYGIEFTNRKLDTITIAKTIFRDKVQSYSLSALTKMFGIRYMSHRALNDALATAQLFLELAQRDDEAHCGY